MAAPSPTAAGCRTCIVSPFIDQKTAAAVRSLKLDETEQKDDLFAHPQTSGAAVAVYQNALHAGRMTKRTQKIFN
jgi:hypothetical protein